MPINDKNNFETREATWNGNIHNMNGKINGEFNEINDNW